MGSPLIKRILIVIYAFICDVSERKVARQHRLTKHRREGEHLKMGIHFRFLEKVTPRHRLASRVLCQIGLDKAYLLEMTGIVCLL